MLLAGMRTMAAGSTGASREGEEKNGTGNVQSMKDEPRNVGVLLHVIILEANHH